MKRPRPENALRRHAWRAVARQAVFVAVDVVRIMSWSMWLLLALLRFLLPIYAALVFAAGVPSGALFLACLSVAVWLIYEWFWPSSGPPHKHLGGTAFIAPKVDRSRCFMKPRRPSRTTTAPLESQQ